MDKKISNLVDKRLKIRNRRETRFRLYGLGCILIILSILFLIFSLILYRAYPAFLSTKIGVEIDLGQSNILKNLQEETELEQFKNFNDRQIIAKINYRRLIKSSLQEFFGSFDLNNNEDRAKLAQLVSKISALELKQKLLKNPKLLGQKQIFYLTASSKVDIYFKHHLVSSLNDKQIQWLKELKNQQRIKINFNLLFFKFADSREPEIAGVAAGIIGSFLTILIFLICAFPIAVMSAFYLEEFASKNRFTDLIEVSINNLAAIPSIIYGILGLTVYLQFCHLPRSSSLVGGMTLFLLVLPIIIISTRNTIRSIPASIKDAALAMGASKMQIVLHHLLPLSIPGIMTGTILAIARALGETAPLLMIGMVAFIADIPHNFYDPTTVIPVQIYLWSLSPEIGFVEKTSAAIVILLALLISFNSLAVLIRKKFEIKW
jgi:phosphate transport system permease protein